MWRNVFCIFLHTCICRHIRFCHPTADLEQNLKNFENEFGTLYQKTSLNPILGGLNPAISDIFSKWLENYEDILVKTSLTPQKKAEVS